MKIRVKILGSRTPQRYAVRRLWQSRLPWDFSPDFLVDITEVKDLAEIEKVTPVLIYPSLVVNDKLVFLGRFPKAGKILI